VSMAIHIVRYGESLWSISQKYGVPIQSIIEVNDLSSSALIPGLALYVPDRSLPIRSKLISSGDTLWNLASRYRTTLNAIIQANPGLNPNALNIGQVINIPSPIKLSMQTLSFVLPYSEENLIPILKEVAEGLTYLAISSYSLTDEGYAYQVLPDEKLIAESIRLNVTPLLMIRNLLEDQFSPEILNIVLNNPQYRRNLINSLVNFVQNKGYGGISIDFEFIPPARRDAFVVFLYDLKGALGSLILHVNVHAKTEDILTNKITGGHNYREIGRASDIVAVMTIDYGYPTGPPNPVSPIWWMRDVIEFAVSEIDPRKLQMALPLYGYEWQLSDNQTTAYSLRAAQNQAINKNAIIRYDQNAETPWYDYWEGTVQHRLWFDDIRSFREKYKLIDQYNLLGTTFWQLNLAFPQNWPYIDRNFHIIKK